MVRIFFYAAGYFKQRFPVAAENLDIGNFRLAFRQSCGFIQQHGIYRTNFLKAFRVLIQNTQRSAFTRRRHYRDRRRKPQSARAGYHQHVYSVSYAVFGVEASVYQKPNNERKKRNCSNRGNEYPRNFVGKFLNGRLACSRFAHHSYYLGQRRLFTYAFGAYFYEPALDERSRRYAVACRYFNRQTFARNGAFIHESASPDDFTVNGNIFALSYDEYIARLDVFDRHRLLYAVNFNRNAVGRKL